MDSRKKPEKLNQWTIGKRALYTDFWIICWAYILFECLLNLLAQAFDVSKAICVRYNKADAIKQIKIDYK